MSPGVNDHYRNTGALPKSNRRSNRNRERDRSALNQNRDSSSRMYKPHTNNLFQLDWHPVSDRLPTKQQQLQQVQQKVANFINGSPPGSYDLTADFGAYNSHSSRLYPKVYKLEDLPPWLKTMPHPCDTRTQSPPAKPTNTDKMPDRVQVEGRLNQIREYIKVTSTMMDSLNQSGDPRAQAQREKLSRMVEDLYDSEQKLSKLLEESQKYWRANENGELENGEVSQREHELRKKVEESQRNLAQLQEHQSHLVSLQLRMREQLNEAREAQRAILDDTEDVNENGNVDNEEQPQPQQQCNVEQLERETETLRDKLQQLENKKRQMDNLVHELQVCELSERASCSSDGGRPNGQQRDKLAELEAMKAQLQRLKSLMNCATHGRADSETEVELHDDDIVVVNQQQHHDDEAYGVMDESASNYGVNSIVNDDSGSGARSKRGGSSGPPPSVEQIQAVTRELKEQQQLLHTARAELQRLRQAQLAGQAMPSSTVASCSTTPPPLLVEKKQSNSSVASSKHRQQLEDLVKKDHSNGIGINQNGAGEWGSRRGSNSQHSHVSTPGNLWPPPANPPVNASHDQTINSISTAENIMEIGSQPPLENGFGNNFWGMPPVLENQPPQGAIVGSAEYYRQLLLGSQAQQLQLMNTTIQQCCQLLWSQQREMQSMRVAISQLQSQVRSQSRQGGLDQPHDDQQQHSNLGRAAVAAAAAAAAAAHYGSLEAATLPPSSSLPNLVSLPSSLPAPPAAGGNCYPQQQPPPQQQQQQLNNQVPPGNRANNYWDNFRSYSRQNLLSGSSKTATDCASGTSVHITQSANSAGGVIPSHVNNKCNRQHLSEHHLHHHHMPPNGHVVVSSEAQYSLNLQQLERDSAAAAPRNNYVPSSNDASPQPMPLPPQQQQQQQQQLMMMAPAPENLVEEAAGGVAVMPKTDESCAKIAKAISEREDLRLILMHCLKVLESRKQNESPLPSSNISNSSDSSDDESEAGGQDNPTSSMPHIANVNASNAMPAAAAATADYVESSTSAQAYNLTSPQYLMEQSDYPDTTSIENAIISMPCVSSSTGGNNDDFEADRLRQENSNNNHQSFGLNNEENANGEHLDDDFLSETGAVADNSELDEFEDERVEFVMLDHSQNSPTNQWSPQQQQQYRRKRSRNCIVGSNIEHLQK